MRDIKVKVHPSKSNLKKEDQLAWKIAEIASDKAKIDKETSREIEHNFEYFYSNNLMWFTTESFVSYMKKYKSETIYKELFDKSIMGLSNETQEIVENLIKCNQKKYLKFLAKLKTKLQMQELRHMY